VVQELLAILGGHCSFSVLIPERAFGSKRNVNRDAENKNWNNDSREKESEPD